MVVALLILIVLILLFGAAAMRGVLGRIVSFALTAAVAGILLAAFAEATSEDTLIWILLSIPAAGLLLLAIVGILDARQARAAKAAKHREANRKKPKIERLWFHFRNEIAGYPADAQAKARQLYNANDVNGLREFCRNMTGNQVSSGCRQPIK